MAVGVSERPRRDVRRGSLTAAAATTICETAESAMARSEFRARPGDVFELVGQSSCTAYDCEFVAVAREHGVRARLRLIARSCGSSRTSRSRSRISFLPSQSIGRGLSHGLISAPTFHPMPQFSYRARNAQGGLVEGVLNVPDRSVAIRQIEQQNCMPIRIEAVAARAASGAMARPRPTAAVADAKPQDSARPVAHFHRTARPSAAGRDDARRRPRRSWRNG